MRVSPILRFDTSSPSPLIFSSNRQSSCFNQRPCELICSALGFRDNISVKFAKVPAADRNVIRIFDSQAAACIALDSSMKFNGSTSWYLPSSCLKKRGELCRKPISSCWSYWLGCSSFNKCINTLFSRIRFTRCFVLSMISVLSLLIDRSPIASPVCKPRLVRLVLIIQRRL